MISNFEAIKKQLSELAAVINAFKSEAVQLKIIDLIFEGSMDEKGPQQFEKPNEKRKERKTVETGKSGNESARRKRSGAGTGAVATLIQLLSGDFFSRARTINDIIEHCKLNLARTFKANEFSGKLGRMVRNNELKRSKNKDGQYEYRKP